MQGQCFAYGAISLALFAAFIQFMSLTASDQLTSTCSVLNGVNRTIHRVQESHSGPEQVNIRLWCLLRTGTGRDRGDFCFWFGEKVCRGSLQPWWERDRCTQPFTVWVIDVLLKSSHYLGANRSCQHLELTYASYFFPRWLQVNEV